MGNISSLFPLPVYLDKPEGETFEKIQEELLSLCEKTDFSQKGNWNKDTHMLSKDPFKTNILLDNNCTNVVDFIYKSATNYIEGITGHGNYQYNLMESWLTKTMNGQYAHELSRNRGAAETEVVLRMLSVHTPLIVQRPDPTDGSPSVVLRDGIGFLASFDLAGLPMASGF